VVRAVRAWSHVEIDGVLDEEVWREAPAASGFRQRWPVDGAPATERTEVRVAFDGRAIYFGMIMYDSQPHRIMRSILHREGRIDKDDRVIIALDTYHDRRSAYVFELNAFGTQGDAHFTNERLIFPDDWMWEGVYESAARITERGWELEVAIPLTTIRFDPARMQTMGVAFYRSIRRKNEEVTWPHIPLAYTGTLEGGMDQASRFAPLTGLEGLRPGRHVEVKPFGIVGAQKVEGVLPGALRALPVREQPGGGPLLQPPHRSLQRHPGGRAPHGAGRPLLHRLPEPADGGSKAGGRGPAPGSQQHGPAPQR